LGEYKNTDTPVKCLCKANHECSPRPTHIQQGDGMCLKCAGKCPAQGKENFIRRIEELGGKVIGEYQGSHVPVKCICKNNILSWLSNKWNHIWST
jgi:hypothetical protein